MVFDGPPAYQMLVDDPREHRRIAAAIPRPFRIHDGDGASFANAKAIGFRAQDPAGFRQSELLETLLQKLPRFNRSVSIAALGVGLIGAEKDMAARARHAYCCGKFLQAWQFLGWHMIKDEDA
jgi:hypothetical protein